MVLVLTLPSDSSLEYFPNNTLSHFRVQLPQELTFDGPYEVGLTQLQYPRTWFNIPEEDTIILVEQVEANLALSYLTCKIAGGTYESVDQLVKLINLAIQRKIKKVWRRSENFFLHYSAIENRVHFQCKRGPDSSDTVTSPCLRVSFSPAILLRLGFIAGFNKHRSEKPYYLRNGDVAEFTVDLDGGFKNIYVNTDIIKQTHYVGHTLQSVLRVVPIQGRRHEMVLFEPIRIDWFPLRFNRFRQIEISLTTDLGQYVKFERGKTVVTLHIRRAREFAE